MDNIPDIFNISILALQEEAERVIPDIHCDRESDALINFLKEYHHYEDYFSLWDGSYYSTSTTRISAKSILLRIVRAAGIVPYNWDDTMCFHYDADKCLIKIFKDTETYREYRDAIRYKASEKEWKGFIANYTEDDEPLFSHKKKYTYDDLKEISHICREYSSFFEKFDDSRDDRLKIIYEQHFNILTFETVNDQDIAHHFVDYYYSTDELNKQASEAKKLRIVLEMFTDTINYERNFFTDVQLVQRLLARCSKHGTIWKDWRELGKPKYIHTQLESFKDAAHTKDSQVVRHVFELNINQ